jgi:hypothetical protein
MEQNLLKYRKEPQNNLNLCAKGCGEKISGDGCGKENGLEHNRQAADQNKND